MAFNPSLIEDSSRSCHHKFWEQTSSRCPCGQPHAVVLSQLIRWSDNSDLRAVPTCVLLNLYSKSNWKDGQRRKVMRGRRVDTLTTPVPNGAFVSNSIQACLWYRHTAVAISRPALSTGSIPLPRLCRVRTTTLLLDLMTMLHRSIARSKSLRCALPQSIRC
ncbi:hypothetical protein K458DRAFT_21762 [Lentithecium fluviatile CBS 122367]|uniref:Uncharacterized protein n=1 Tax=Lentithecium fluviatile CBS 122367 TaxID=1168545 RepID=A0A6G1J3Y3_9PLEO|nr:hypothetical protein K458DRAFT_21762 [Lentithecium fluviatile CBS 122367]